LLIFVLVYFLVFGMGFYYMMKMMKRGPEAHVDRRESRKHPVLRNRPLDALEGE
jgi:cytochrome d ubiquinol oxidase subunit I